MKVTEGVSPVSTDNGAVSLAWRGDVQERYIDRASEAMIALRLSATGYWPPASGFRLRATKT
jgi:hypothetical protein